MESVLRRTGLPLIGDVPWGTHLCQFYRSKDDLIESVVPYFEAGLASGERCLWITSDPFRAADAEEVLRRVLPGFEALRESGQIEILDHEDWYLHQGATDADATVRGWIEREQEALRRGFSGLRLTGNTSWLDPSQWDSFAAYESKVHRAFHDRRILALCSYWLAKCGADQIVDVLRNHGFALMRRNHGWELSQSATSALAAVANDRRVNGPGGDAEPRSRRLVVPAAHTVQFYDQGSSRAPVAAFLAAGLRDGEAAVLLARAPHTDEILRELASSGVEEALRSGRLVVLDAEATLEQLLDAGVPDANRFEAVIGALIKRLAASFDRVRAYGEMVDVLSERGCKDAAIALETLWNSLIERTSLVLSCGYSLRGFDDPLDIAAFRAVCAAHGEVRPADDAASWRDPRTARLMAEAELRSRAAALAEYRDELTAERARCHEAEREARADAEAVTRHLVLVQEVTSALSEAATPADVARVVVTTMASALGAGSAILAIPSADGERLTLLGHNGLLTSTSETLAEFSVTAQLPAATAFRTGEQVWLPTPEAIAEQYPQVSAFSSTQAIVCVPVTLSGRRLGALGFGFFSPRRFTATERAMVDDLARQVTLALDRAGLYAEAQRSRDRLNLLAAASARFSEAKLDLDKMVHALVEEVTSHLSKSCGVLLRSKDDESRLSVVAIRHVRPEADADLRAVIDRTPIRVGEGIVGGVARTGVAVRLSAVREDALAGSREEYRDHVARNPIGAMLVVPLRASGALLGVVAAARDPLDPTFTADDQALLQELADRAGLSIECALMYGRAEHERRRAEEANQSKDDFLAMLGHELRNPLAPIVTALELIRLRDGGAAVQRELHVIERQVRAMTSLVDDLLDVSKITRGKIQLSKQVLEAAQVVGRAVEVASPLLDQRRHHLEVSVPPCGLKIDVDEGRMAQVIANLLINAAKYTEPGGRISVEAGLEGVDVVIRVRDNGVGIAPGLLPRIFEAFVQGERTPHRGPGGLGIGLAIAKSLLDIHGGAISVWSDGPGRGSEFTVRLPLAHGRAERPSSCSGAPPEAAADTGARGRILVVDDNRDAADSLADALRDLGYAVEVAYDGPSALTTAGSFRPDAALLDIGLPAMDGYEVAAKLRCTKQLAPLRLVALTGYGQEVDRARARSAGFDAHLIKPVALSTVTSVLEPGADRIAGYAN